MNFCLAILFFITIHVEAKVIPKKIDAYFSNEDFISCIQKEISDEYNNQQLHDKILEIKQRRQNLADQNATPDEFDLAAKSFCPNFIFSHLQSVVRPLGCAADKLIDKILLYHSAALIKYDNIKKQTDAIDFFNIIAWQTAGYNIDRNVNRVGDLNSEIKNASLDFSILPPKGDDETHHQRECMAMYSPHWQL